MALIKCPKCQNEVPDSEEFCPNCGYRLLYIDYRETTPLPMKAKKSRFKTFILLLVCLVVGIAVVIGATYFLYNHDKVITETDSGDDKYPLFKKSSVLESDPYGLSNENSILGKDISEVLKGYVENEDYTVAYLDESTVYTFPINEYPFGKEDYELAIFTQQNSTEIDMIMYSFRLVNINYYSHKKTEARGFLNSIRSEITHYYDEDPFYQITYKDGKPTEISMDEFYKRWLSHRAEFSIMWATPNGEGVILNFTNLYDEKDEYGSITFVKWD